MTIKLTHVPNSEHLEWDCAQEPSGRWKATDYRYPNIRISVHGFETRDQAEEFIMKQK